MGWVIQLFIYFAEVSLLKMFNNRFTWPFIPYKNLVVANWCFMP